MVEVRRAAPVRAAAAYMKLCCTLVLASRQRGSFHTATHARVTTSIGEVEEYDRRTFATLRDADSGKNKALHAIHELVCFHRTMLTSGSRSLVLTARPTTKSHFQRPVYDFTCSPAFWHEYDSRNHITTGDPIQAWTITQHVSGHD